MSTHDDDPIRIVTMTSDHIDGKMAVESEGFSSKRFCCCVPVLSSRANYEKAFSSLNEEKLSFYGLAVDSSTGDVLGFVDLGFADLPGEHDMPSIIRHAYNLNGDGGECYVEKLAVASNARGKGIGKKLLRWADEKAINRGCKWITLAVIHGNRAKGLYERHGFVTVKKDECEICIESCVTGCCLGLPYFPETMCPGVYDMKKDLSTSAQTMER